VAFQVKKLLRDKRAWTVAGVGGAAGVGIALYRRRQGGGAPAGTGDAAAGGSLPYISAQPSVYDSSLQDFASGFDQAFGDLQQQLSQIQDQLDQGTPPSSTTPPPPATGGTAAKRYVTRKGGHPVSYAWLQGAGYIRRVGGKWVSTRKLGGAGGHPVSYSWLQGIGFIKPAA
jgi:hypothetical protein